MKKIIIFLVAILLVLIALCGIKFCKNNKIIGNKEIITSTQNLKELPLPEITGGERGKLGIDKNINELTIDEYLGRNDSIYRDMRMLEDPGNYEAIGGDSYLSGYIKGFEVVPLPYIIPVKNLPKEVGNTYDGVTLFSINSEGKYVSNYKESMKIIEELFPKDKNIFLICGGGGYAGMMKEFLVSLGWDGNKIYNVGAYWYYDGENNVEIKKKVNGETIYDFDSVPYHNIDFNSLTKIENTDIKINENIDIPDNKNEQNNSENENVNNKYENARKVTLDNIYYGKESDYTYDTELDLDQVRAFDTDTEQGKKDADEYLERTIQKKADIINELIENKASFVVIVYNTNNTCIKLDGDTFNIAGNASSKLLDYNIYGYRINLQIFKKTKFYEYVRYGPTVVVIEKGEVVSFIDANKDLIENDEQLNEWIKSHINIKDSSNNSNNTNSSNNASNNSNFNNNSNQNNNNNNNNLNNTNNTNIKEQETSQKENSKNKVIVIDPGHQTKGNSEKEPIGPGATETKAKVTTGATGVSTGQKESELNLKVSLLLKEELTKKGYTVIMTRTINDVNMSNSERAKIANNANADAFIRIHANSASSSSAKGVLTMCQTEKNIYNGHLAQDSYNLSKLVVDNIVKKTGANNRSVTKTDTMSGINWCTVPTTIVEMGFLSNPEEDKLMATQEYQKKIVDGIVQGIEEYFESK